MGITLAELDELWQGQNIDKSNLKLLCRKYGPHIIIEWINRGLTIHKKDMVIEWYKQKLRELGVEIMEKPKEVKDERLFKEDYGDYFGEE